MSNGSSIVLVIHSLDLSDCGMRKLTVCATRARPIFGQLHISPSFINIQS